jgi:hypothetical protein
MNPKTLALVLVTGALAVGCQQARSANPERNEALERRIAELEKALAASPSASPAAAPRPPAKPKPRSVPKPARVVVPAGTQLSLLLETPLSTIESLEGDRVTARVEAASFEGAGERLPPGAVLRGRVVESDRAGRVSGRSRLSVAFDQMIVRGRAYEVDTTPLAVEGADGSGKDAKIIAGAAAAGGVIGAITGRRGGFGKGVLIGAGTGTGAVLATRGKDVEMPSGSRWAVTLRSRLTL